MSILIEVTVRKIDARDVRGYKVPNSGRPPSVLVQVGELFRNKSEWATKDIYAQLKIEEPDTRVRMALHKLMAHGAISKVRSERGRAVYQLQDQSALPMAASEIEGNLAAFRVFQIVSDNPPHVSTRDIQARLGTQHATLYAINRAIELRLIKRIQLGWYALAE